MTDYDVIEYPHRPVAQAQPDRLAVLGNLLGMTPANPANCRVLELGCGSAASLVPLADLHPASSFLGIDVARTAIELGRQRIAALGLGNLRLECMDLLAFPPDGGQFDYIIAHGLFSWVPESLRAAVLNLCHRHLAPQGIAYISYNTYPGCYVRQIWRDMMLYHTAQFADRQDKIDQARSILQLAAQGSTRKDAEHRLAKEEHARLAQLGDASIFHDELAPIWQPFLFREFISLARRHGLQYLAEAAYSDMQPGRISGNPARLLERLKAQDRIHYEQYLDFFKMRHFRQTLLCRQEVMLRAAPDISAMAGFHFSAPLREMRTDSLEAPAGARRWRNESNGVTASTNHPLGLAALAAIADAWPTTLSFADFAAAIGDRDALFRILHEYYASGLIHAHAIARPVARGAGDRPQVWRVARLEANFGSSIPNLHLGTVDLREPATRGLLCSFDGEIERSELATAVGGGDALQALLDELARKALLTA